MARKKADSPPPTKILSQGPTHEVTPEELAQMTSSNVELANQPNPEPPQAPQEPVEPEGQRFEFEEEAEPGEFPSEEPTGDPLEDTKRKLHETTQELAKMKKVVSAITAERGIQDIAPQPSGVSQYPREFFNPNPTYEEQQEPYKYTQRMLMVQEIARQQGELQREMQDFVDRNPNWQEYYADMQQIKAEDPYAYQGPGTLTRLIKRAKERRELTELREKGQQVRDQAFQAGAQMQRQTKASPFVSPQGQMPTVPSRGPKQLPLESKDWKVDELYEWLKKNGYVRPDVF